MGLLSREQLLKKVDLKIKKVDLENDHFVYVREMTGREKDWWEQSLMKEVKSGDDDQSIKVIRSLEDARAKLAVCTVCNENGDLLFKFEDWELLSKHIPAQMLSIIALAATEINKVRNPIKNSVPVQNDFSASESGGKLEDSPVLTIGLKVSQLDS
jgi:hypothetical protein